MSVPTLDDEAVSLDPPSPVDGAAPTGPDPRRTFRVAVAVAASVVAAAAALLFLPWLDDQQKRAVGELLFIACPLAAMACCLHTARLRPGRARTAWLLLAGACAAWAVGNACLFAVENMAVEHPFPMSDAFHSLAFPLATAALLTCPTGTRTRTPDKLRVLSAILLIGSSVLFISYQLVLDEVFAQLDLDLASAVIGLHLIGDVVLVSLGIVLIARSRPGWRTLLLLLGTGVIAYGMGDAAYAVVDVRGFSPHGTAWDLVWIGGYLLIGLAALAPVEPTLADEVSETDGITSLGSTVVHLCMVLAIVTAAYAGIDSWLEVALGGAVLVFFGIRQSTIAADSEALRRDLEAGVAGRVTELSRLLQRHQRILDAVGEGIYGVDNHGVISFVNPAAEQQLGRAANDLVGQPAHAVFHTDSSSNTAGCHLYPVLTDGQLVRCSDVTYRRQDGTTFPVELTAAPKLDVSGHRGAVVIFSDISERRALERMKEEFVSVVSHELRTPLTAIRGSLGLLAGGAVGTLPVAAEHMVRIALDSSDRLTRLINDLLDMERLESGALPMEFLPVSCATLVTTTMTQLQAVADAVEVTLVSGPVAGRVSADADRIVQALTNLVGNALKFSSPGSEVTVTAEPAGTHVCFRIVDTGRGIPVDMLQSVFARFHQVDSSDSREKGGTGLGLAITKTIVERHGGRIWVESEPGRGATFQFTLPAVLDEELSPRRSTAITPADAPAVLLCDDDSATLEALAASLDRLGYATTAVARGGDVVATATASRPDVIMLDLLTQTPWETVQELKAGSATRDIPIVMMSGPDLVPRDLGGHTAGWLTKPVAMAQAGEVLSRVLRLTRAKPCVLVVEDDADVAAVLVAMLQRHGLRAYSAATQQDAVVACRTLHPDLLVLDLVLPQGDGFGVVDELRRDGLLRAVPVVVYSAQDIDAGSRERLRLGDTTFLTKTRHSPEELAERVIQVIQSVAGASPADRS